MGPTRPVLVFVMAGCAAQAAERPRGVSPDDARYDVEGQSFSCLAGAFVSIPAAYVNDDYCDCPDGSDEPGTSACAGVGRTVREPLSVPRCAALTPLPSPPQRFFCANIGSEARWLSPLRVQDGVCDCCDGSDEVGTAEPCPDACEAEGRARREALQQRLVDAVEGTRAREEALESAKATFAALSQDAAAAEEVRRWADVVSARRAGGELTPCAAGHGGAGEEVCGARCVAEQALAQRLALTRLRPLRGGAMGRGLRERAAARGVAAAAAVGGGGGGGGALDRRPTRVPGSAVWERGHRGGWGGGR